MTYKPKNKMTYKPKNKMMHKPKNKMMGKTIQYPLIIRNANLSIFRILFTF